MTLTGVHSSSSHTARFFSGAGAELKWKKIALNLSLVALSIFGMGYFGRAFYFMGASLCWRGISLLTGVVVSGASSLWAIRKLWIEAKGPPSISPHTKYVRLNRQLYIYEALVDNPISLPPLLQNPSIVHAINTISQKLDVPYIQISNGVPDGWADVSGLYIKALEDKDLRKQCVVYMVLRPQGSMEELERDAVGVSVERPIFFYYMNKSVQEKKGASQDQDERCCSYDSTLVRDQLGSMKQEITAWQASLKPTSS